MPAALVLHVVDDPTLREPAVVMEPVAVIVPDATTLPLTSSFADGLAVPTPRFPLFITRSFVPTTRPFVGRVSVPVNMPPLVSSFPDKPVVKEEVVAWSECV